MSFPYQLPRALRIATETEFFGSGQNSHYIHYQILIVFYHITLKFIPKLHRVYYVEFLISLTLFLNLGRQTLYTILNQYLTSQTNLYRTST